MTEVQPYLYVRSGPSLLIISVVEGVPPNIIYFGRDLPNTNAETLALLSLSQRALGAPDLNVTPSLSNEIGLGANAAPGLIAHRNGQDWANRFDFKTLTQIDDNTHEIVCVDRIAALEIVYRFAAIGETGCFSCTTHLTNTGEAPINIDWLAALVLPIPQDMERFTGFSGRWSQEFSTEEFKLQSGSYVRENRAGRTSHESPPFLIAKDQHTSEYNGACIGMHLAWSGNHRLRLDRHTNGAIYAQMGALLYPGEVGLGPQETYTTPFLYFSYANQGLNALSQAFHDVLTHHVLDKRTQDKPRPVHYNTWEAVYFDHSDTKLKALADKAAAVGTERFVLDDGWFGGRRNDAAGLGDWCVSGNVYPNGLRPLADYVRGLGMEFGLWFEPEMVNPDSDLYRDHPDWVLQVEGVETIPYRNQLILDLTRQEVADYLFEKIDVIVRDLGVGYIKWDMNRDNTHPGGSNGRAVVGAQTYAVYALMQRLRAAHPELEIESCSSGGARADFAVLQHTDRIWTSDNNDALERQRIQRGASYGFPLSVMGTHVGPKTCHITGRVFDIRTRVASAIFGHMGIEADLGLETDADLVILKAGVALYKQHRRLLHLGHFYRLETSPEYNAVGVVARDLTEALFSCMKLASHKAISPPRLKFVGLASERKYRVRLVWPQASPSLTYPSIIDEADLYRDGLVISGEALMTFGVRLPLTFLDVGLIYHLEAVGKNNG